MTLKPYWGFDNITFNKTFNEVCFLLKNYNKRYKTEHWPNKGCDPEVSWDIIRFDDRISLFFAKGKMFKMYFENTFDGKLFNGIKLGMTIDEAVKRDPSLRYDDWEEEYVSEQGYWLEDDPETNTVVSISIFIKEVENDEVFNSYRWCDI